MPRRILFVEMAHSFGGSVVSLYHLARGLDRTRYEPVILLYHANEYVPRFEALGLRVIVWDAGGQRPTGAVSPAAAPRARPGALRRRLAGLYHVLRQIGPGTWRLWQVIRSERIDLVHLNDVLISNREGIMAARLAGVPCLSHVRAFEQLTALDRFLLPGVSAFVYISQAIAAAHEAQGAPPERGRVIYNALEPAEYAGERAGLRAELGLDSDHQVVALIGRLVAWKGQDVFLRALARLAESHPNLRGLIVGDGEPTEPTYPGELHRLAAGLGLAERVRFTGYRPDIPALLASLDVLVHCSVRPEPFGRVLIEGMAAGVPVVGAAAGAVTEIIEENRCGLVTAPGDDAALAEAIGRLLDDAGLRERLTQAARQRVHDLFTVEAHVRQIQALYVRLLGE